MSLSASDVYEQLARDDKTRPEFTLSDGVDASEVKKWLDEQDVSEIEKQVTDTIHSEVVSDPSATVSTSSGSVTVGEVIQSAGDEPRDYDAVYIISGPSTIVQYFEPGVGGLSPMDKQTAEREMQRRVESITQQHTRKSLLDRARLHFGV